MFELIFHPEAEQEIYALNEPMQGKVIKALEKLEAKGNQLRYPDTRFLQNELFELRVGKKDITRTLFAFAKGKKFIFYGRL
ncbi:phage derived protein, Gp49-like [Xenorhabdus thuongxuanensis]|uniref:Phage derived protein, Gp49-like n=1 Tax=Xenorhabdus thuongxuanensis TaxID=1873484 RepID=A0A1Q5THR2_9GAMM|nr:phage derived protein, Gp49-like [Xenorhabdus thuongxuanensis]